MCLYTDRKITQKLLEEMDNGRTVFYKQFLKEERQRLVEIEPKFEDFDINDLAAQPEVHRYWAVVGKYQHQHEYKAGVNIAKGEINLQDQGSYTSRPWHDFESHELPCMESNKRLEGGAFHVLLDPGPDRFEVICHKEHLVAAGTQNSLITVGERNAAFLEMTIEPWIFEKIQENARSVRQEYGPHFNMSQSYHRHQSPFPQRTSQRAYQAQQHNTIQDIMTTLNLDDVFNKALADIQQKQKREVLKQQASIQGISQHRWFVDDPSAADLSDDKKSRIRAALRKMFGRKVD